MTKGRSGPGGGHRQLRVRLKTARRHSASSQRWLERQLNDPYVAAAQREGYRSRAAFKLKEIDDKHRFLKPGGRVVDLGAAPGGWSQIAAERTQAVAGKGQVVAIDVSRHGGAAGRGVPRARFHGRGRGGAPQGAVARGARRRGAVRHGGADDRPHAHRSSAHHGARGRRGARSPATCWSRGARSSPRCCRAAPSASCSTC